jgi:hypothetical protein
MFIGDDTVNYHRVNKTEKIQSILASPRNLYYTASLNTNIFSLALSRRILRFA